MNKALKCRAAAAVVGLVVGSPVSAHAFDRTIETAASLRLQQALQVAAAATRAAVPLTAEEADRWRIQQHLAKVEASLRNKAVAQLSDELRRARETNLELLHAYWMAGRFPRNTQHPGERRPYFIDHEGTACAVGHLVEMTGSLALAQQVDRRLHNAYVPDMDDPELAAWASQSGLSVDELALIQPSYCMCGSAEGEEGAGGADSGPQSYEPVCGADGLTYWNECAANLCAEVPVAHAGECEAPAERCETCGVGSRLPVVTECAESPGEETMVGVCRRTGGDEKVAVNLLIAEHWLELQSAQCPADSEYDGTFPRGDFLGQPWRGVDEEWTCTGTGGSGGNPRPGEVNADDSGCALAPPPSRGTTLWMLCLALAGLARRFRRTR